MHREDVTMINDERIAAIEDTIAAGADVTDIGADVPDIVNVSSQRGVAS